MAEYQGKTLEDNRPLSPHLGIYKWQLTMAMSIIHRLTGVILFGGTLLLAWWIVLNVYSEWNPNILLATFFQSIIGKIALLAWTASLMYHLCNGLRHLFWDIGVGFEVQTAKRSGVAVLIATIILTALSWYLAFLH
jgi:succinate dehydrogenase / fumarate reductase, cytochrome b subunit